MYLVSSSPRPTRPSRLPPRGTSARRWPGLPRNPRQATEGRAAGLRRLRPTSEGQPASHEVRQVRVGQEVLQAMPVRQAEEGPPETAPLGVRGPAGAGARGGAAALRGAPRRSPPRSSSTDRVREASWSGIPNRRDLPSGALCLLPVFLFFPAPLFYLSGAEWTFRHRGDQAALPQGLSFLPVALPDSNTAPSRER